MFLMIVVGVICCSLVGVSVALAGTLTLFGVIIYRRAAAEGVKTLEAFLRAAAREA